MPNDAGFTGIYGTGSNTVILRFSETSNLSEQSAGLTPSIAVKFLVDNYRSNNIFAMHSFSANEGSFNFFENSMANRVAPWDKDDNPIEF